MSSGIAGLLILAATFDGVSLLYFVAVAFIASEVGPTLHAQEQPVTPPPLSAEQQQRLASMPPAVRIYEEYRYWSGFQPAAVQKNVLKHYDDYLARAGVSAEERQKRLATIKEAGRRLEVDRWNRILSSDKPTFNVKPNAFLAEVVMTLLVVEASHRVATKTRAIGGGVVYDTNELLGIFRELRVLRYEDVDAEADFGIGQTSRVVRLAAQKTK